MVPKKSLGHRGPGRPAQGPGPRWPTPAPAHAASGASALPGSAPPLHWPRTLAAKGAQPLRHTHLHRRVEAPRAPRCHLVLLDTSGSMRRNGRLAQAKGCAAWLVAQAARAGDHLGLLAFGGQGLHWLLPPGPARRAAAHRVPPLGGGGGTPLARALALADAQARRQHAETWLWLLTDGRCAGTPAPPQAPQHIVLVDHDDGAVPVGRCGQWALAWGARHIQPHTLPTRRASP